VGGNGEGDEKDNSEKGKEKKITRVKVKTGFTM